MKAILFAAVLAAGSINAWSTTTLSSQPQAAIYLEDPVTAAYYTSSGDYTVAAPKWALGQWGIPQALTGTQTVNPNTDWNNANAYGRVGYVAASHLYELGANGQLALPACLDSSGAVHEYDLLLEPNNQDHPSYTPGIQPSATLDHLTSVKLNFGHRLTYQSITAKCAVNYGSYIVSLILSDTTTAQTLFYQFILLDSRGGSRGSSLYRAWCPGSTGSVYCVDTSVAHFGMPLPTNGGPRYVYNFDVYSELKSIIQTGHATLDTNIAHWKITGVYFGDIIVGGAAATTQWDSFSLTTAP